MARLTMRLPASMRAKPPAHRMVIRTVDGKHVYNVRMAPKEVTYEGHGNTWSEVPVPGRSPFLVREGKKLRRMSFTIILANSHNMDADMTGDLRRLNALAETRRPIKIAYDGYFDRFTWRMTNYTIVSQQRHPATSAITRAEVSLEFTIKSDVKDFTGPVSGGARTTTGGRPNRRSKKTTRRATSSSNERRDKKRTYTVKRGDTLWALAYRWYGDGSRWRKLADMNNIRNPRKLPVGKRLKY